MRHPAPCRYDDSLTGGGVDPATDFCSCKKPPAPSRTCACGVQGPGKSRECHAAYYGDDDVFSLGPHGAVGPTIDCQCSCHNEPTPDRPALAVRKIGCRPGCPQSDMFPLLPGCGSQRANLCQECHAADVEETNWRRATVNLLRDAGVEDTPAPQPAPEITERPNVPMALRLAKQIVTLSFGREPAHMEIRQLARKILEAIRG